MPAYLVESPDVQVYATFRKRAGEGEGVIWVCHHCLFNEDESGSRSDMVLGTKGDLLVHLYNHQKEGHSIPTGTLATLAKELAHEERTGKVIYVGKPTWQSFIHRAIPVTAFRWDRSLGECIPQIQRLGNSSILMTDDGDVPLQEGDWVVRSSTGSVWRVSSTMFDRIYNRK